MQESCRTRTDICAHGVVSVDAVEQAGIVDETYLANRRSKQKYQPIVDKTALWQGGMEGERLLDERPIRNRSRATERPLVRNEPFEVVHRFMLWCICVYAAHWPQFTICDSSSRSDQARRPGRVVGFEVKHCPKRTSYLVGKPEVVLIAEEDVIRVDTPQGIEEIGRSTMPASSILNDGQTVTKPQLKTIHDAESCVARAIVTHEQVPVLAFLPKERLYLLSDELFSVIGGKNNSRFGRHLRLQSKGRNHRTNRLVSMFKQVICRHSEHYEE